MTSLELEYTEDEEILSCGKEQLRKGILIMLPEICFWQHSYGACVYSHDNHTGISMENIEELRARVKLLSVEIAILENRLVQKILSLESKISDLKKGLVQYIHLVHNGFYLILQKMKS